MKTVFRNIDGTKRNKYDTNTHKSMKIPDGVFLHNNRLLVIVYPKNACKLLFAYHIWLPYLN